MKDINAVAIEQNNVYAKRYLTLTINEEDFPALDVINSLTSAATDKPLSAAQGKLLKQLLDNATIEAQALTFDLEPTPNSANPVTSDGINTAIQALITLLQGIKVEDETLIIPSFQ